MSELWFPAALAVAAGLTYLFLLRPLPQGHPPGLRSHPGRSA